jgi:hypothetical protein
MRANSEFAAAVASVVVGSKRCAMAKSMIARALAEIRQRPVRIGGAIVRRKRDRRSVVGDGKIDVAAFEVCAGARQLSIRAFRRGFVLI